MHLNAKPPLFVPREYWGSIEKLSKAALMDIVWDYATRTVGKGEEATGEIFEELMQTAGIITHYRKSQEVKKLW